MPIEPNVDPVAPAVEASLEVADELAAELAVAERTRVPVEPISDAVSRLRRGGRLPGTDDQHAAPARWPGAARVGPQGRPHQRAQCRSSWASTSPTSASCWTTCRYRTATQWLSGRVHRAAHRARDLLHAGSRPGRPRTSPDRRHGCDRQRWRPRWRSSTAGSSTGRSSSSTRSRTTPLPRGSLLVRGRRCDGSDFDVVGVEGRIERDGEVVATGHGADVFGDPAAAVAWLVNKLAEFGAGIRAGEIVIPGALTASLPLGSGSRFTAAIDGLGSVSVGVVA